MKVLYIVNIPAPYRVSFFNELGKFCDLTVLFERKFSDERDISWHGIDFSGFKGMFLQGLKYQKDKGINPSVIGHLHKNKYDLVVIGGYSTPTCILAIIYLKLKNTRFVINVDGGMIKKHESFIYRKIKTLLISSASAWLSTCSVSSKYLQYYGAQCSEIYLYPFTTILKEDLIPNVLSIEEKIKIRNELGICGKNVILCVGQFVYRKGFDVLLNSGNLINEGTSIYFIGGEPTDEYVLLREKVNKNNVHFIGFKSKEDLKKYYMAADIFVFPTREDIWGLVINEAIANGLPVITTDKCVAGLELIKNYINGFIIPINDVVALSTRVNELLDDQALQNSIAINNLELAEKYTIENMANETYNILDKLFQNKF